MGDEPVRFSAEVVDTGRGRALVVPPEVAKSFSSRQAHVVGLVGGQEYRSRLATFRRTTYLWLRADLVRSLGLGAGSTVEVVLAEEAAPVEPAAPPAPMPLELDAALTADATAGAVWHQLPEDHRQEYRRWVGGGEDELTRAGRAARLVRRWQARRPPA